MATNLGIDERLLAEAQRLGQQPTKKATVNEALTEYIKRRRRLKSLELIGKINFDPRYDYKKSRRRK
jgi:Arc/MetJ family transcription regulator